MEMKMHMQGGIEKTVTTVYDGKGEIVPEHRQIRGEAGLRWIERKAAKSDFDGSQWAAPFKLYKRMIYYDFVIVGISLNISRCLNMVCSPALSYLHIYSTRLELAHTVYIAPETA